MADAPRQTADARMEPLPTLPIFYKLSGRRVLVAGGSPSAVWKVELLAAAGADVHVVAPDPCPQLRESVATASDRAVTVVERAWTEADLDGAALAVGAIEDDTEAERFRQAAKAAGVPVNVVDKPAFCDFQFGTIVARSPLVLAITTDGAAPVFGQAIRMRLEALLPDTLRAWARAAQAWRPAVQARDWNFRKRRRFWELVANRALDADGEPDAAALEACLAAADRQPELRPTELTLVGCGAGPADELTFAGARALQNADVILHDPDVLAQTVQFGRREAEKRAVGDDAEAYALVAAMPVLGRRVAWLGTGNPASCPHWARRREFLSGKVALAIRRGLDRCPRCGLRCLSETAVP